MWELETCTWLVLENQSLFLRCAQVLDPCSPITHHLHLRCAAAQDIIQVLTGEKISYFLAGWGVTECSSPIITSLPLCIFGHQAHTGHAGQVTNRARLLVSPPLIAYITCNWSLRFLDFEGYQLSSTCAAQGHHGHHGHLQVIFQQAVNDYEQSKLQSNGSVSAETEKFFPGTDGRCRCRCWLGWSTEVPLEVWFWDEINENHSGFLTSNASNTEWSLPNPDDRTVDFNFNASITQPRPI